MPEFRTIREVAKIGLISEHYLRLMVKQRECPGIYSGKKFLVNVPALIEKLDNMSREAASNEQ